MQSNLICTYTYIYIYSVCVWARQSLRYMFILSVLFVHGVECLHRAYWSMIYLFIYYLWSIFYLLLTNAMAPSPPEMCGSQWRLARTWSPGSSKRSFQKWWRRMPVYQERLLKWGEDQGNEAMDLLRYDMQGFARLCKALQGFRVWFASGWWLYVRSLYIFFAWTNRSSWPIGVGSRESALAAILFNGVLPEPVAMWSKERMVFQNHLGKSQTPLLS